MKTPRVHDRHGFASLLIAVGIVSMLGMMSLVMQLAATQHTSRRIGEMNKRYSFYLGELGVWHSYFRFKDGLSTPSPNPLLVDVSYAAEVTLSPDEYSAARGSPMNVSLTRQFAPAKTLIRRYDSQLAGYIDTGTAQCSTAQFQRKKYRLCLAMMPAPAGAGGALIFDSQKGINTGTDFKLMAFWKDSAGVWQRESTYYVTANQGEHHIPVVLDSTGVGYAVYASDHTGPCVNGVLFITRKGFENWTKECFLVDPQVIVPESISLAIENNDRLHLLYVVTGPASDQVNFMYRRRTGNSWEAPEIIDTLVEPVPQNPYGDVHISVSRYGPIGNPFVHVLVGRGASSDRYWYERNPVTGKWGPGPDVNGSRAELAVSGNLTCDTMTSGKPIHSPSGMHFSSLCISLPNLFLRSLHTRAGTPPWTHQPIQSVPGNYELAIDISDNGQTQSGWPGPFSAVYPSGDNAYVTFGFMDGAVWREEFVNQAEAPMKIHAGCKHMYVDGKGMLVVCNKDTNGDGYPDRVFEYYRTAPNTWVAQPLPASFFPFGTLGTTVVARRAIGRSPSDWLP